MSVMHLWAIGIGAAALALPLVIHRLTRPKPVVWETSTFRFIKGAMQERQARHRLRDFIILALRTAAVALLAIAFARPMVGDNADAVGPDVAIVRVIVLDASQSMAAGERGIPLFERARAAAAEHFAYRPGATANLIVAATQAEPAFARPSANFTALRDELARVQVRSERFDVAAAVNAAAAMFADAPTARRELIFISDFQRAGWSRADFASIPADVLITFESVAPAKPLDNLAMVGAKCRVRSTRGREAFVEIEAANHTPLAKKIDVEVRLGDAMQRLQGSVPAQGRATLTGEFELAGAESGGWRWGEARIVGGDDDLPADDVRPLVGRLRPAPTIALVTRQPAGENGTSSYFLATALTPGGEAKTRADKATAPAGTPAAEKARLLRVDPARSTAESIASADVIVVDHPDKLGDEWISQLVSAARRGRTIVYAAAQPIDAVNLHRLAAAGGADWRFPVDYAPPAGGRPRADLLLAEVKTDRPPFAVFGEQAGRTVSTLRFHGGLTTKLRADALADDVLASFGDHSVFLAVGSLAAGKVAVVNADLEASSLARTQAFVPLLTELIDSLVARDDSADAVDCGTSLAAYLPTDAGRAADLRPLGPDGEPIGRLRDESLGPFWEVAVVRKPGVCRVTRSDAAGAAAGAPTLFAAAVVVPAEESDLRTLPPDVLTDRIAAGRPTTFRGVAEKREKNDDWWVWLASLGVCCLLVEVVALKAFRT